MPAAPPPPRPPLRSSRWRTALGIVSIALLGLAASATAQNTPLWPELDPTQLAQLQACLVGHKLNVVTAALSDARTYYQSSQSDNLVFHYNPSAIVHASSTQDVQAAVRCAAKHGNIAVAARSGGHSFGGYGSGGRDGSLVIDVGALNKTVSHPHERTAEIWTGARLGDVVKELWSQGDGMVALAHGTCPSVGVGGHAICGGFGPTSRAWGMTMDHILEADVVLADGSLVTASQTQNQDLLWAIRGAGSYVGIVTRFLFRTHDVSTPVVFFEYRWTPSLNTPEDAAAVFTALQAFALSKHASEKLGFHIQMMRPVKTDPMPNTGRKITLHVRGNFLGTEAEFGAVVGQLWKQFRKHGAPMPDGKTERSMTFLASMQEWDDFGPVGHKLDTLLERQKHNNFVAKTLLTLDHTKGLTPEAILSLYRHLFDTAVLTEDEKVLADGHPSWFLWNLYFEFYGGPAPAYRTKDAIEGSAFPWRDGLWLIQASAGTDEKKTIPHGAHVHLERLNEQLHDSIARSGIKAAGYSCYLDPDLSENEWRSLYYGPSLRRLEEIKARVDPTNLLRNPQSLGSRTEIEHRWKSQRRSLDRAMSAANRSLRTGPDR
ncbi:uncharacterized protein PFL1_04602 [Pseudozyma flocculosa PF-1]|uniref:Related to 6-hydroxy-D-nicotine oxidase n=2 Tax=Pseudozyma flocculosa TaxID=84751 RepID=A0A5C3F981_9BASI|nr:uncharacterized protein PFL1_04602 [Pseudozyma flocculosa PF-1]EPQ27858.1 hypothetical protein PFL1_04602 [Pseudozyma flocculosa PF-1]SPO41013.1 related to 6-hydroxy-D-nicotine oxidase [Pseudozyma flocculosa]